MSKSISENPAFLEIWVRVWWVANQINCNVGFVCISLHTVKVKAEQFRSKAAWSKLLLHLCLYFLGLKCASAIMSLYQCKTKNLKRNCFVPCCHVGLTDCNSSGGAGGADRDSGKVSTNTNHLNVVLKSTHIYLDRKKHKHPRGRCCLGSSTWMVEITHTYSLHLHLIYFYSIIVRSLTQTAVKRDMSSLTNRPEFTCCRLRERVTSEWIGCEMRWPSVSPPLSTTLPQWYR